MSMLKKGGDSIVIGGEPRIDFLPPEIKQKKVQRRAFRGLIVLVVMVAAVCVLAYAGVTTLAIGAQARLDGEQQRTLDLISAQGKYSNVRSVAATVATAKDARLVSSAPEIIWGEYFDKLKAALPEGASITRIAVNGESATTLAPASPGPLAVPQVAEITLTGVFGSLDDVAQWKDAVEQMKAVSKVWITPVSDVEGVYLVEAIVHVNSEAFAMRLFEPVPDADEGEGAK